MKDSTRHFYIERVIAAVHRIATRLDEPLEFSALARSVAMSSFHFHRIFHGLVGETPLQLQRRLRLERAAEALREGEVRVIEIALAAGYAAPESFSRAFRQHFGVSPRGYRRRVRPLPPAPCGLHHPVSAAALAGLHLFRGETMNVTVHDRPDTRIAALEHRGAYARMGETFGQLGGIAGPAGLFGMHSQMVAIYVDDPETTPEAELRSLAGVSVAAEQALPAGLTELTLPAGRYARLLHRGPYSGLAQAWSDLYGGWLALQEQRAGHCFEVYRNMPGQVPEDELETELWIELKPATC